MSLTKFAKAPDARLEDVEWRADSDAYERNKKYTCRWVPHLTYTICADLLDEWVGPNNWRIDGYGISEWNGQGISCTVSVRFEDGGEWISRTGYGDMASGIHQTKGSESDAFKRCVGRAWGCGRNVYDLPTLYAPCDGKLNAKTSKMQAYPNAETDPALVRQLKALGHKAETARAKEFPEDAAPANATPDMDAAPQAAPEPVPVPEVPRLAPNAPAAPTAVSEVVPLPTMMGQLPASVTKLAMAKLKEVGLWPVGKLEPGSDEAANAASIIAGYQKAADAAGST